MGPRIQLVGRLMYDIRKIGLLIGKSAVQSTATASFVKLLTDVSKDRMNFDLMIEYVFMALLLNDEYELIINSHQIIVVDLGGNIFLLKANLCTWKKFVDTFKSEVPDLTNPITQHINAASRQSTDHPKLESGGL
jgi:hypothetical protein